MAMSVVMVAARMMVVVVHSSGMVDMSMSWQ